MSAHICSHDQELERLKLSNQLLRAELGRLKDRLRIPEEPKPCPFRGDRIVHAQFSYQEEGNCYVGCICGARGSAMKTKEDALAAWNRRMGEQNE